MRFFPHLIQVALFSVSPLIAQPFALEENLGGYTGTDDNSIYEDSPDNTNGGATALYAGTTASSFRRALIRFDLTSLPPSREIDSVDLRLVLEHSGTETQDGDVYSLHRLTKDWGEGTQDSGLPGGNGTPAVEGDATWRSNFHNLELWTAEGGGGDIVSGVSASVEINRVDLFNSENNVYIFTSEGLAADVRAWIDDPASNHGWILIGNEFAQRTARRFISSEGEVGLRPRLTVRFVNELDGISSH